MRRLALVFLSVFIIWGCAKSSSSPIIITENFHEIEQVEMMVLSEYLGNLESNQELILFFEYEILMTTVKEVLLNDLKTLSKQLIAVETKGEVFPVINEVPRNLSIHDFVTLTHIDEWGQWAKIHSGIQLNQSMSHVVYTLDQDMQSVSRGLLHLKAGVVHLDEQPILGIVLNAPHHTMMSVYSMVKESLDANQRVLVIEVDGLGYSMLDELVSPWDLEPALSTFPSISNVSLAAMLTGKSPSESKIRTRNDRLLEVPTMFDLVEKAMYIEGDTALLSTSIDVILHLDRNDNGTDDEVFESAKHAVTTDSSLIFVHFHGVDDVAHEYGPRHQKTIDKWQEIRGYIERLQAMYDGRIILVSDHGLYQLYDEGTHGSFHVESMFALIGVIQDGK